MNNKSGGGANTNVGGLNFEKESLRFILKNFQNNGYRVEVFSVKKQSATEEIYKIFNKDSVVGIIGTQNTIFKWLDNEENFKKLKEEFMPSNTLKNVWSKDLEPDIVLVTLGEVPTIHIFECKYQNASGSVDEKIQTATFKKELWVKLFKQVFDEETNINYHYLLSKWFKKGSKESKRPEWKYHYQSIFDFLKVNNILFFINDTKDWESWIETKTNEQGEETKKNKAKFILHDSDFKTLEGVPFNPSKLID